jgi:hypothetical protein
MQNSQIRDADIRPILRDFISRKGQVPEGALIIEELGLCRGQVRVDMVVVDEWIRGFEIKSDRDDLRRFAGQVEFYSKVLHQATLVVGDHNISDAMALIPNWWGVLRCSVHNGEIVFERIRLEKQNPRQDARYLVELLWRDQAIALLESKGVVRGVKSKPREAVWDRICEYFSLEEISSAVLTNLKIKATEPTPA